MLRARFYTKLIIMSFLRIFIYFKRSQRRDQLRVLIFHDVQDLDRFNNLIRRLDKKWNFITPEQFISFNRGLTPIKGKNLLITFDDGFKTSFDAQVSILSPMGIKSVFFLATSFITTDCNDKSIDFVSNNLRVTGYDSLDCIRPMSWENANELSSLGCLVASHSATHLELSAVTAEYLHNDLELASTHLSTHMNSYSDKDFAFPFGSLSSINSNSYEVCCRLFERIYSGFRGDNNSGEMLVFRDSINLGEPLFYTDVYLSGILDMNKSKISSLLFSSERRAYEGRS